MKLFKNTKHSDGEMWGELYHGGMGGSSSNWPGKEGRPPLIVPSGHFIIYFHTDPSGYDWGWKMIVTVLEGECVGYSDTTEAACFATSCFQQQLMEGPAAMPEPVGLESFPLATTAQAAPTSAAVRTHKLQTAGASSNTATVARDAFGCPLPSPSMQPASDTQWPRYTISGESGNSLEVHSAPEKRATLIDSIPSEVSFSVVDEKGTGDEGDTVWAQVQYRQPHDAHDKLGWVIWREYDSVFLSPVRTCPSTSTSKPETLGAAAQTSGSSASRRLVTVGDFSYNAEDLVELTDDPYLLLNGENPSAMSGCKSDKGSSTGSHPMCAVLDAPPNAASAALNAPTAQAVLRSGCDSVHNQRVDAETVASTLLAQDCISALMQQWPEDLPFSLDLFGGRAEHMLAFIKQVFRRNRGVAQREEAGDDNAVLRSLMDRLVELLDAPASAGDSAAQGVSRMDSDESGILDALVNLAVTSLSNATNTETGPRKPKLSPLKALLREVETSHEYSNNMDTLWDIWT